jgi:hypothetical protein
MYYSISIQHQIEELEDEHVPNCLVSTVFGHHRVHLQAELEWTRDLVQKVTKGVYDDESEQMQGYLEGKTKFLTELLFFYPEYNVVYSILYNTWRLRNETHTRK